MIPKIAERFPSDHNDRIERSDHIGNQALGTCSEF